MHNRYRSLIYTLIYLLGSRYCETDRLSEAAWQLFEHTRPGWDGVQAICDYVHHHITFDYMDARVTGTALETLGSGHRFRRMDTVRARHARTSQR